MLVLGRKLGERIIILCPDRQEIEVVITKINNHSQAQMGIIAPKEYIIIREELRDVPKELCDN
jgi:carbon storage regulator CsrA